MRAEVHQEHIELAERHWWFRARREIFAGLLDEFVAVPEGASILDLGPGGGSNLPILRGRGRVTVLDMDRGSLRNCAEQGARELLCADANNPPLSASCFDLLCALDVLEHLEDDRRALREWRQLLRPTGQMMLSVPALPILWGRQDLLSGHYRRYRRGELRDKLENAGFEIQRLSYFNFLLFPPILLMRLLMRPFIGKKHVGSDFSTPRFGLDGLLYKLFATEGNWLKHRNLPIGVSLIAIVRPAPQSLTS
ncbi:MAG: class I SAM-dependent methyltransferase [Planctomycetota bacterium]